MVWRLLPAAQEIGKALVARGNVVADESQDFFCRARYQRRMARRMIGGHVFEQIEHVAVVIDVLRVFVVALLPHEKFFGHEMGLAVERQLIEHLRHRFDVTLLADRRAQSLQHAKLNFMFMVRLGIRCGIEVRDV